VITDARRRASWLSLFAGALLVTALAAPAGASPQVAIIGDSIGDRARVQVHNAVEPGHDIVFYETQDSATIRRLGPLLLDEVQRPNGPDIAIVELGVGNAFWGTTPTDFRKQVRYLTQQLLHDVTCVRWLEQKPGGNRAYPRINTNAALFNRILREEVNDFARARTVHYEAWTRMAGDGVFVPDLLHLNARGKRGLARLVRQAVEGCDPAVTSGRFWDVPDRYWASTEIDWVGDHHLIDGYANGTYRAEVGGIIPALDRLDWIRALWRRAGRPQGYPAAPWDDASGPPLAWAWGEQVTGLPADASFRPAAPVTRGDAIGWLYRAEGTPDPSGYPDHGLTDVPPGLRRAVRWAEGVGVIQVPDGGRFLPRRAVTRAEAATFLYRVAHAEPPAPIPSAPAPSSTVPPTTEPPATTLPPTTEPPSTTVPTTSGPPPATTVPPG
jgi:hypothetical protein